MYNRLLGSTAISIFLLCCILVTPCNAQDGQRWRVSLAPDLNYLFGQTQYDMKYMGAPDENGKTGIRSLLEFPINMFTVGGTIRVEPVRQTRHPVKFALSVSTKVNDPAGKMIDHDWDLYDSGRDFKWSYTESKVEAAYLFVKLESSIGFPSARRGGFDMIGGIRYERIAQEILDFAGWQYDSLGNIHNFYVQERALYYKVSYLSPYVGFRFKSSQAGHTAFHLQAAVAPTRMSDFDDHKLRYKTAVATGWGEGVLTETGITFPLGTQGPHTSFLQIRAQFDYFHGNPRQTQTWYGDDPFTSENDTGSSFPNIPHEITLTRLSVGVRLGVAL